MNDRITDKKLANKRFRKTEEAIIMAFFVTKDKVNINRIIKTAGISRSTLYRHHKSLDSIVPNYERYIIKKYNHVVKCIIKCKNNNLKSIYQRILIFLSCNKIIINFLYTHGDDKIIEKMIMLLKPYIASHYYLSQEKIFNIYAKEVTGLMEEWIKNGYSFNTINNTVDNIVYITKSAYTRLSPIIQE
ncbi:TetR/AcrR family transcriptional regulator [Candidatus Saccharibacteria bacterium]|nr:TetR/AcrR family transcriptional regulator [Candidatus Saccharibacteria bacterium]MBR2995012.1 TetR/AcrR family transcriptional regulator [Candidatus Saccharibacteria bacterium]MBR2995037.1 TetR/AcrR family transcriptional regulator [Candidatus Saccharibacteria bacterium]